MKDFDKLDSIYERPETLKSGDNDTRAKDLGKLNDNQVVDAYRVPWEANGHLADATDDVIDSVWAMQDGRRDVRQLKKIKEL
jgi:hypothetical protein